MANPGQLQERTPAPGVAEWQRLQSAGFSADELNAWRAEKTQSLTAAGFEPKEISGYWGDAADSSPTMARLAKANLGRTKIAETPWEQMQAGFGATAIGLGLSKGQPEYVAPTNAGLGAQIFTGLGQLTGDLPLNIAGFIGGAVAGGAAAGAAGSVVPVAGTAAGAAVGGLVGGGFGSGALPIAAREAVTAAFNHGEFHTAQEGMAFLAHATMESLKGGTVGAITAPIGGAVGGKVAGAIGSKIAGATADMVTQAVGGTALGGAFDGRMPNATDFTAAVALGISGQAAGHLITRQNGRTTTTPAGRYPEKNAQEIYTETGTHPQDVGARAATNVYHRQELLQQDVHGDPVIPKARAEAPPEVEPFEPRRPAAGTAADVVKDFEGFITKAKWDVNAFRTGYGSDTVTHADGRIEKVTKDTVVTQADAERDLTRRLRDDFEPRARRSVGEAWHGLDPDTQHALISVTYNYGSLPERVARAARTGDNEKIAQAVEDLRGDNDGVNKGRREKEAQMIRGGGGGGKPPSGGPPGAVGGEPENLPAIPEPETVKGERTDWGARSPEERYKAAEAMIGEPEKRTILDHLDGDLLIDQYTSELRPARVLDNEIFKNHPEFDKNRTYGIEDAMRNTYASDDRVGLMLQHGRIDGYTNDFVEGSASLANAVKQMEKSGGNVKDWRTFMLAARTVEKSGQGIKTGMDPDLAKAILSDPKEMAKYKDAVVEFQKVGHGILAYAVAKGRYSEEQVRRMVKQNLMWVSMRRVQGDHEAFKPARAGNFKVGRGIRKMEGGDGQVVDPIMASIDNWRMIVADADRNEAIGIVVRAAEGGLTSGDWGLKHVDTLGEGELSKSRDLAKYVPPDEVMEKTAALAPDIAVQEFKKRGKGNEFLYFRDGKAEVWATESPALARLLRGAESPNEMHLILAAAQGVASVKRAGITSMPDFALKTTLGDQVGAFLNDPFHPPPIVTLALGVIPALTHNAAWKDWVAKGGAGSAAVAMDRDYLTRDMGKIFEETGATKKLWNVLTSPIELSAIVQERIDTAQRVGYKLYAEKALGVDSRRASMQGRKAYIDFKEKATLEYVNTLAKVAPFLRPTVQGMKNLGEAIASRPAETALLYGVAGAAIFGLALLSQKEDDDLPEGEKWANMPNYARDLFVTTPTIAGIRFKLATRDALSLVNMTVNRFVDHWKNHDRHAFDNFAGDFFKSITPSLTPAIIQPVREAATNYSEFSQRPLIPASLEGVSGPMQYTESTSGTAKKLAALLGNVPGADALKLNSPIIIDNYIRGYGGTLGLKIAKTLNAPDPGTVKPEQLADNPFIAGFVHRETGASAQPISDFYDAYEKVKEAQGDLKLAQKRRDHGEMKEARGNMLASVNATAVANVLRQSQIHIQAIYHNKDLTTDEKRQQTEQIYGRMVVVAKRGLQIIDRREDRQKAREAAQDAPPAPAPADPVAAPPKPVASAEPLPGSNAGQMALS